MIRILNDSGNFFVSNWPMLLIFVLIIGAFVAMMVFQSKKRKKQEQEAKDLIDAVKPGNKVKTIGGICGIVVEVDAEENTFVLETGSVTAGKSYVKFDRQAIWQTDAVAKKDEEKEAAEDKGELNAESAGEQAKEQTEEVQPAPGQTESAPGQTENN